MALVLRLPQLELGRCCQEPWARAAQDFGACGGQMCALRTGCLPQRTTLRCALLAVEM